MGNQRIYNGSFSGKDYELYESQKRILSGARQPFPLELPLTVLDDEDFPDKVVDERFNKLGKFIIEDCKIILYSNRIAKAAQEIRCSQEDLTAIVFAHEMGHYIYFSHPLICSNEIKCFPEDCYDANYSELYEIYAQLFAMWSADGICWADKVFAELSKNQSGIYLSYNGFRDKSQTGMINAIPELRDRDNQQNWSQILKSLR